MARSTQQYKARKADDDETLRLAMIHIRSDNGPEFVASGLQDWLVRVGIRPLHIYTGSHLGKGVQ
ncbi:hypothetical protein [Hyphomonas pacifica]|uniref:Integrase catalytic domain-containing protein n=1 Tax=Hyphomonas pacifica TaxID=1280941 RepID=A0A062U250_9PROT|nr:hypothetical protein [Hyphomonas pacifica]KCZ51823.1 hypothetical protein HY2_10330 [Hyphomonas pacifica]RAN34569.1 hypothetical protein HY3_10515 [Hyphomonas pacifica]RAN36322.1 hypothetical protein HY11_12205 [Hyphomonas pacifica]